LHPKAETSPLLVSERAEKNISVVIPEADFRSHQMALEVSMKARGMDTGELNKLVEGFNYLDYIQEERAKVTPLIMELRGKVTELKKANASLEEKQPLLDQLRPLIAHQKELRQGQWTLEQSVMLQALDLPNLLSDASVTTEQVLRSHLPQLKSSKGSLSHSELAGIDLRYPISCGQAPVLFGRLANFEMLLQWKVEDHLQGRCFWPLAGPDLVRSVVLDGCGADFSNQKENFALRETKEFETRESGQAMHLVGGASLFPFVTFFSKNIIHNPERLPQTYYNVGRQYHPREKTSNQSLFHTEQSNAAFLFDINTYESDKRRIKDLVQSCEELYESLNIHFRTVARPPDKLCPNESHRVSFELFSPAQDSYVEVGHLSCYGHYLSKRMMLKAKEKDKLVDLRVIAGTIMDLTKVIGCLVEIGQNKDGDYILPSL